jgi:hypothetical protein
MENHLTAPYGISIKPLSRFWQGSGWTHRNCYLPVLGAFLALRAKNRAFRSNSSDLPMQILRDFRFNPLRVSYRSRVSLL